MQSSSWHCCKRVWIWIIYKINLSVVSCKLTPSQLECDNFVNPLWRQIRFINFPLLHHKTSGTWWDWLMLVGLDLELSPLYGFLDIKPATFFHLFYIIKVMWPSWLLQCVDTSQRHPVTLPCCCLIIDQRPRQRGDSRRRHRRRLETIRQMWSCSAQQLNSHLPEHDRCGRDSPPGFTSLSHWGASRCCLQPTPPNSGCTSVMRRRRGRARASRVL